MSQERVVPSGEQMWQRSRGTDLFTPFVVLVLFAFTCVGIYLKTHNPPVVSVVEKAVAMHQTHFIIEEKKIAPAEPKPPPVKKEAPLPEEPIDLTEKPLLAQEKNEIVDPPPEPEKKTVRRVYGLKKVYSTGIGATGSAADAIIGKHGNTLATTIDTIKATESDLSGTPVSVTTVTSLPKLIKTVKPEYTKEMLEHRIEGVVRVYLTVDIDGKVKRVMVLDDLGFGSKQMVAEACFKWVFEPAMVGDTPKPTTIMQRIRFEMLDG